MGIHEWRPRHGAIRRMFENKRCECKTKKKMRAAWTNVIEEMMASD